MSKLSERLPKKRRNGMKYVGEQDELGGEYHESITISKYSG